MNKEQEQQIKNDRRLFIALVGTYGLILGLGIIESCNNRLRGVETICYPTASRAGLECIEKPILKGGD